MIIQKITFAVLKVSLLVFLIHSPAWGNSIKFEQPIPKTEDTSTSLINHGRSLVTMASNRENQNSKVTQAVLETLSSQTGLPENTFQVVSVEAKTWPDACLGLPQEEEMCAQVLVSGHKITVVSEEKQWIYRSDESGTEIRLESETILNEQQ